MKFPETRVPKDPLPANSGIIQAKALIIVQPAVLGCFVRMQNLPANADGPAFSSR